MVGKFRRAQALIELAIGMFTLALLLTSLFAFTVYIAESLEKQNLNRGDPPKFKVDKFRREHGFML